MKKETTPSGRRKRLVLGSTLPPIIAGCFFGVVNSVAYFATDIEDKKPTAYSYIDPLPPWLNLYADLVMPVPLAIIFCFMLFGVQSIIASCILEFYARTRISSRTQQTLTGAALGLLSVLPWMFFGSYDITAIVSVPAVIVGAIVGNILWRYRSLA